ncbi:hypothetical protein L1887_17825 [Cichorium endivia]|nr:hypothetical protein L1887_17825 [Cichorium endivia]
MDGPIQQIKVCTSLNIDVMEQFKDFASKALADDLAQMFTKVTTNLETILKRLPVLPSTTEGTPGGGTAGQTDEASPSGTKENTDQIMVDTTEYQNQKHQDERDTQEDTHADEGATHNEEPTKCWIRCLSHDL